MNYSSLLHIINIIRLRRTAGSDEVCMSSEYSIYIEPFSLPIVRKVLFLVKNNIRYERQIIYF